MHVRVALESSYKFLIKYITYGFVYAILYKQVNL